MKRLITAGLMTLMAGLLVSCSVGTIEHDGPALYELKVGDSVPSGIHFRSADGTDVTSQTLMSGDHLVVFFDTGCRDCRNELPVLQALYDDYSGAVGFHLISRKEDYGSVARFFADMGYTMPFVTAGEDDEHGALASTGRVPTCWFIRDGLIIGKWLDSPVMSRDNFEGALSF